MPELRLRFEKRGKAAYLSHLDVLRTFQRAFLRAGIRVKHSEGFNPHPKMSIAAPLQLGCESVCEVLDVSILDAPADLPAALDPVLPEGLRVLSADAPVLGVGKIAWTEWALTFDAGAEAAETLLKSGRDLTVEKKTKRGLNPLDIAPHVKVKGREGERLILLLRAAEPTVNTGDVAKALTQNGLTAPRRTCRLALLDGDFALFR
jgi:radical SAM-linked protein